MFSDLQLCIFIQKMSESGESSTKLDAAAAVEMSEDPETTVCVFLHYKIVIVNFNLV